MPNDEIEEELKKLCGTGDVKVILKTGEHIILELKGDLTYLGDNFWNVKGFLGYSNITFSTNMVKTVGKQLVNSQYDRYVVLEGE